MRRVSMNLDFKKVVTGVKTDVNNCGKCVYNIAQVMTSNMGIWHKVSTVNTDYESRN